METFFKIQDCGDFKFADCAADTPCDWNFADAKYARVELPATCANESEMFARGYLLADRTLGVSIDTVRCPVDLKKTVRMEIAETDAMRGEILEIAKKSFPFDRRFNVARNPSQEIAAKVLKHWVDGLDNALVAMFKGRAVGFLALEKMSEKSLFVKLAAVDENFRLTGAALSLYARAIELAAERGYALLEGRISSRNTAVMNLYAFFGARFSDPIDVFLKDL